MVPPEGIYGSADNQGQHGDDGDHNCHGLEYSGHLRTSMAPVYGATPGWANQFEPASQVTHRFSSFSKETLIQFQSMAGAHPVD